MYSLTNHDKFPVAATSSNNALKCLWNQNREREGEEGRDAIIIKLKKEHEGGDNER
jgi:hypothetical protein